MHCVYLNNPSTYYRLACPHCTQKCAVASTLFPQFEQYMSSHGTTIFYVPIPTPHPLGICLALVLFSRDFKYPGTVWYWYWFIFYKYHIATYSPACHCLTEPVIVIVHWTHSRDDLIKLFSNPETQHHTIEWRVIERLRARMSPRSFWPFSQCSKVAEFWHVGFILP